MYANTLKLAGCRSHHRGQLDGLAPSDPGDASTFYPSIFDHYNRLSSSQTGDCPAAVSSGRVSSCGIKKSILAAERRVPELIPVLGSQPAGDLNHEPGGRLPLLSVKPAVTLATLKMAATNFAVW